MIPVKRIKSTQISSEQDRTPWTFDKDTVVSVKYILNKDHKMFTMDILLYVANTCRSWYVYYLVWGQFLYSGESLVLLYVSG